MNRSTTFALCTLALIAGVVTPSGDAYAQAPAYPTRPIRLILAVPPGGATDFIARTIGAPLSARLGRNVVIDHRPGSNGNLSAEIAAKSAPDGHTLLYANDSLLVINPNIYSKMAINPMQDLVPIATTITNQLVLAVNPAKVPVNDFRGFIELAKKAKEPLFYASIGNGSQHHLAMELLKQQAGVDLTHVPYKGGGPASIAVMSGESAVMFGGTSVVTHIRSGKLKGLAVTGKTPWPTMPELPSIAAAYPNYEIKLWHGLFAPVGTPQPIIDRLRAELNAVLAEPQVRAALVAGGAGEPYVTTAQQLAALIGADHARYAKIIKSIGLKLD